MGVRVQVRDPTTEAMPYRTTIAMLLTCAATAAQAMPTLVEVGQARARGGDCRHIVASQDGTRLLTVGDHGDLLWWDLTQRRLLRRIEAKGRYVTALALHPSEPWVVLGGSANGDWQGFGWFCDLDTGATRELWPDFTTDVRFAADARSLHVRLRAGETQHRAVAYDSAAVRGGQPLVDVAADVAPPAIEAGRDRRRARSPDGRHTVLAKGSKLSRSGAEPRDYQLGAHVETWIDQCVVTDDGTIVAADIEGQVHVQGLADTDHTLLSGHVGDAHRLAFSPDGRFLAICGLGAARIVDLTGDAVVEWSGTRLVQPGPEGADFWVFAARELRRWSVSTQQDVVPPLRWVTPSLRLLRSSGESGWGRAIAGRSFHVQTFGAAGVVNGAPWLGSDKPYQLRPWRFVEEQFRLVEDGSGKVPVALVPRADGNVLFVTGTEGHADLFERSYAYVTRFDGAGKRLGMWSEAGFPRWVAVDGDSAEVVVGLEGGEVHVLSADTLAAITKRAFTPPLERAAVFDRGRLLVATDTGLLLLDTNSLATLGALTLPVDLGRVEALAVSRDHRHVAVAQGPDVRILRVE